MSTPARPLSGLRVGLSISESEDSTRRGFPAWQVNRATLQIVSALLGQGTGVVFGHDWREDGVMETIHGFALQVHPFGLSVHDGLDGGGQPLLQNLLPWPDRPRLSADARERLASTLRVEEAGLPVELRPYEQRDLAKLPGDAYAYLRARGLTHLRHRLDERSDARLCLGGRLRGAKGRYPGVIEEGLIALRSGTPLYLAGVLGGASQQIIDAVEGKPMPEDFCTPTEIRTLYEAPPGGIVERDSETLPDRRVDREAVWTEFRQAGVEGLSRTNGLSPEENADLFHTPVLGRVIQLVLIGLSRFEARSPR